LASTIKRQLNTIRQEMLIWPAWRKQEIEAEVSKTPLRDAPTTETLQASRDLLMRAPHDRSHADGAWLETNIAIALAEARRAAFEEALQIIRDQVGSFTALARVEAKIMALAARKE
jgi:hypothetical protein